MLTFWPPPPRPNLKLFLKGQLRPPFAYFRSFQTQTVGFSGIRAWIVELEGYHADHLTTTSANDLKIFVC